MIDHKLPKGWKDLQHKVAEIFSDIGCKTETDKKIQTVRGTVNVDVFSTDESQSPSIVYLCECKHWEKRIPKTIVHSFRTVVQDFGANFGIIISKKGFQKGAYEAAKNTNIKLVGWFDFQDMFEEKWLPAISQKVYNECETFIDYTEPIITTFIAKKFEQLGEDRNRIQKFQKLRKKYMTIGFLIVALRFGNSFVDIKQKFPLVLEAPSEEQNESKRTKLRSLREYVDYLVLWAKEGLREFNELFGESV